MSEWIDFAIYVTFIVLIFVLVPRHGRQFTLPMIADRNPQWLADHHDIVVRVERSRWFLHVCYVWAAASIAVLLGVALDLIALPFGAEAPKWEVLKDLNSTLLIVGLLGWGACSLLWFRWLGTHVPLAETRRATLKPRVASDYLAPSWRIGVEALTVLHLGAWAVIGALGWAGGAKFWWSFAFFAGMTVLFAVMAHFVPRRRPDYLDRMFGEAYRQGEIKAVYFMRLWPVAVGAIVMTEHMTGLDLARAAHLLIVSFVSVLALMVLRVRPIVPPSDTTRYDALAGARRSAA